MYGQTDPDQTRRLRQEQCLIALQNQYDRDVGGGSSTQSGAGQLKLPWGQIIAAHIAARFDGGNRDDSPANPKASDAKGDRHKSLENAADLTFNLAERVTDATSLIHKGRMVVGGDLAESDAFKVCRQVSNFDAVLPRKLRYALGVGSVCLVPVLDPGMPPGVQVVPAHQVVADPYPGDPLKAMRVRIYERDRVRVYDLSDPETPRYTAWRREEDWKAAVKAKWKGPAVRKALWPVDETSGANFPWYWRGEPIMPVIVYQGDPKADCLLPANSSLLNDTVDIILKATTINWISYVGANDRPVFLSQHELQGWDTIGNDINVAANLWADGDKECVIIPNAADAVLKFREYLTSLIEQAANRYNRDLVLKKTSEARSGIAIQLESMGLYQFREEQANHHRPKDSDLVRAVIATWNYMVAVGWLDAEPVPELDFTVDYEFKWSAADRAAKREQLVTDIKEGRCDLTDLWLLDNDMEPTPENRKRAMEALMESGKRRKMLAEAGLLVAADRLVGQPAV